MAEAWKPQGTPTRRVSYSRTRGRPRPEGGAIYSPAIDSLVQKFYTGEFKDEVGLTVSEVFKGGSLGQGTQVKHKYDIDLIIYSRDLREDRPAVDYKYFSKIKSFLEKHSVGTGYEVRHTWCRNSKVTMGISFTYPLTEDDTIEVDLSLSPYFSDHHRLLTVVQKANRKERKLFSAAKWQTEFIANQDQWVKEFCRRIKAWRDLQWDDVKAGCPKSYFLSLLVIIVYDGMLENMKQSKQGDQRGEMKKLASPMTEGLKALIHKIDTYLESDGKSLDLIVPATEPYASIRETYKDLLPPCPRILDPINPSNNLYNSGIYGADQGKKKWAPLIEKIDTLDLSSNITKLHEERFKP